MTTAGAPRPRSPRLSTGIAGLDMMLEGGLLPGDSTLVAGSPGTGKTTLGLHFIAAGVKAREPGVFVTFEYLPQQIYRDAEARGWPLREWEEADLCRIVCTRPEILLAEGPGAPSVLSEAIHAIKARRLVIDSMSHFEALERDPVKLRPVLSGLLNRLRLTGVTSVITHELPQIIGPTVSLSTWGLEFLVDNVVLLKYVELDGELTKAINVMKFRGGDHDRKYRILRSTQGGLVVEAGLAGVENISGGSARRSFVERAGRLI